MRRAITHQHRIVEQGIMGTLLIGLGLTVSPSSLNAANPIHYETEDGFLISLLQAVTPVDAKPEDTQPSCECQSSCGCGGTGHTMLVELGDGRVLTLKDLPDAASPRIFTETPDPSTISNLPTTIQVLEFLKTLPFLGYDPNTKLLLLATTEGDTIYGVLLAVSETSKDMLRIAPGEVPRATFSSQALQLIQQMVKHPVQTHAGKTRVGIEQPPSTTHHPPEVAPKKIPLGSIPTLEGLSRCVVKMGGLYEEQPGMVRGAVASIHGTSLKIQGDQRRFDVSDVSHVVLREVQISQQGLPTWSAVPLSAPVKRVLSQLEPGDGIMLMLEGKTVTEMTLYCQAE